MENSKLSKNDTSVLAALFDPESSLSGVIHVNNHLPKSSDTRRVELLQERERQALRLINQEAPEPSHIEKALSELTNIINDDSSYASAWNNRAQARRMLIDDEKLKTNSKAVADILHDIAQAVSLATTSKEIDAVSRLDAKVLASAHTHRGYLLLLASKSETSRKMLDDVPSLRGLSRDELEGTASRELALGGRYGNETARQLAVKTNPYAKLCGSIVREALTKEISDFYQRQPRIVR
ncbi:uncharacterized protein Z518_08673 [Rhinocladiella mackenziei CBS 650.93]|uniref:Uncharacterized protein n=1 Tax=Rhinocladiella mackenziei CBS 650.93 TaxID=1442369 RepID=A0A0D2IHE8_9EURO|nr:uncharacterized protein Z518_08673 [Rhinocladiella mackenziei CBS 650.93]KIX02731.1 hypothetical protein Z518_08673 [Rhinocladiella mackenziei CBS 650.93]